MEHCGISTESGVSESSESSSPSVSGVSGWCSWGHSGYTCLTHTLDTTEAPDRTQSMNITKDLSDILNRLLHIESDILNRLLLVRNMESAHVNADVVYANQSGQDSSEGFEFRSGNDSPPPPPPPLPIKAPTLTLTLPMRPNNITTPGSPRVTGSPRATGSPKYPGQSPRIGTKYNWDSQDTSFNTATSKESQYVEQPYKERLLLHNYLRTIQVQETTKKKSNMVINKYIILTFVLTNIMVLGFSILGTILVMNNYNICHCAPNTQAHIQIPDIPDSLHRPQDSPSMKHHSDDTHDKKDTPTLQTGRVGLPAVADRDYKITISVSNKTAETGTEDFWNS